MLDKEFTQDIQKWLDCPREQRDLAQGALMLLRLNRNRFLHAHIVRHADWERLEKELTKHLRIRIKGLTQRQVAEMEQREMPRIKRTIEQGGPASSNEKEEGEKPTPHRGKRSDHDNLPEEVQAIYEKNGEIFRKMKQLFETLKKMENDQPCDRHEYLSILVSLDEQYRENWAEYDSWQPSDATEEEPKNHPDSPATAKQISAARKYLSLNRPKLAALTGDAHDILIAKMQRRVDLILSAGESFDPIYQAELAELGLTFIAMSDEVRE